MTTARLPAAAARRVMPPGPLVKIRSPGPAHDGRVPSLRVRQPGLAEELDQARARIDAGGHLAAAGRASSDQEPDLAQARWEAHSAWEHLLTRIRSIEGFENFFVTPGIRELTAHAKAGPIIFTYTSSERCDALILTDDPANPVGLVPLPKLTEA